MKIPALVLSILAAGVTAGPVCGETKIRVGHFPNITHAQGVVAHALSRQGKGWFEQRLGPGTKIEWFVYNAGPSAMEAIFANSIDLTYVGPGPALNAYTKSNGQEIPLVSSVKFLNEKRDLAKKFAQANAELTDWIIKNPEEAQQLIKAELLAETKSDMSPQLIDAAWKRIVFTAETPRAAVEKFMQNSVK